MSRLLFAVPLALLLTVSVCKAVDAPFRHTWWCGSAYATRPDEASSRKVELTQVDVAYSALELIDT